MSKKKAGYCVYHYAHRGIGRSIRETDNMEKTKKELEKDSERTNIVCDADKKKAIQKYNNSVKKNREKYIKQREKKKAKELLKKTAKKKQKEAAKKKHMRRTAKKRVMNFEQAQELMNLMKKKNIYIPKNLEDKNLGEIQHLMNKN